MHSTEISHRGFSLSSEGILEVNQTIKCTSNARCSYTIKLTILMYDIVIINFGHIQMKNMDF